MKFLKWVWRYQKDSRPLLDAAIREHGGSSRVVELRTQQEVAHFYESL